MFYLAYGCIDQHVADTTVCRDHLKLVRELVVKQRWHCGQCNGPVISGMYRLISSNAQRIVTRRLDGTEVSTIPNPDYTEQVTAFNRGITDITAAMKQHSSDIKDLEGKCPCPRGHLGQHKLSCDKAKAMIADNLTALPVKRSKVDEVTQEDWEDLYYGGL